jgi:cobalt-zinc-cadmium efflux system outer membrane protein
VHTFRIGIVAAIVVALARPSASGEQAGTLRLADVLAQARSQNPAIAAARERAKAASFAPVQASAYDDPTIGYEAWNAPEPFDLDHADNNILKLSQRVPFPGKRSLAGKIAERDADVAGRRADAVELDVVASVKRAYYALWQAHQNLRIYSRDKKLAEQFATIAEQKYAVGQVSQPDVLRAQVELTRLVNRVTTQTLGIDGAAAELNALLSRPAASPLGVPEDPPVPRLNETADTLADRALEKRPEPVAAAAAVAREEEKVRMARLDYFPDFEFAVSRFFNFDHRDGVGLMASLSLPIAYKWKYDAALGEADARLQSARAELRRQQDRVRKEVEQAFLRARTALLQRELYVTTHVPQAEQALSASEIAYQTGKLDFLSLIDSVRAIESVHLDHVEAEASFEKAFADLERAVGGPIERGGAQ